MRLRDGVFLTLGLCVGAGLLLLAVSTRAPTDAQLYAALKEKPEFVPDHPDLLAAARAVLQSRATASLGSERRALMLTKWSSLTEVALVPTLGARSSPRVLTEFTDYACAPCKASAPILRQAMAANTDLRVAILLLPIGGAVSDFAARVAFAAYRQNPVRFEMLHELLMTGTQDLTQDLINEKVKQAGFDLAQIEREMDAPASRQFLADVRMLAADLHLSGVPAFMMDAGLIMGGISESELQNLIASASGTAQLNPQVGALPPSAADPERPFLLTDQRGDVISDHAFRGSWLLVLFGFTHCPGVCPTSLARLHEAFKRLGPGAKSIRIAFISVDPDRDSPAVLARYLSAFGPEFTGLTGTREQIGQVAATFGAYIQRRGAPAADDYSVDHSSLFYLIDPAGHLSRQFAAETTSVQLAADLRNITAAPE